MSDAQLLLFVVTSRVLVGMHRTSGAVLVALGVRLALERRG